SSSVNWLEQDMSFFPERELDHLLRRDVLGSEHHLLVGDREIVHLESTALDLPPRLSVRTYQPRFHEGREHAHAGLDPGTRNSNSRKGLGQRAFLEGATRSFRGSLRSLGAVQQGGRLGCQDLLGLIEFL